MLQIIMHLCISRSLFRCACQIRRVLLIDDLKLASYTYSFTGSTTEEGMVWQLPYQICGILEVSLVFYAILLSDLHVSLCSKMMAKVISQNLP